MLDFLFNLIVKPLQLLFEFIFANTYTLTENIVLSIFILSFVVSVLCLPLYLKADELQEEENNIQKKLAKRVKSIKENFKGDERQLLLQTYYRQNNYHPIMGLRLSLSLLLQVPIFMAAYTYFSSLSLLDGLPAGTIANLAAPDGLFQIYNFKINIFPILMTIVNLQAGFIYTKTKSFKENKALVIMSLIFLIILYNAPSALVIYWLCNNLFSLIKNICLQKISREKLIQYSLISILVVYYLLSKTFNAPLDIIVISLTAILITTQSKIKNLKIDFDSKKLFILSALTLWCVLGLLIPSNVISTSPTEFIFPDSTPLKILFSTATVFAGGIIFWGLWIYYFSNTKIRKLLSVSTCLFLAYALINLFILKIPLTILLNTLNFETLNMNFNPYSQAHIFMYLLLLSITITMILREIIKKQRTNIINRCIIIILISVFLLSTYNYSKIIFANQSQKTNITNLISNNEKYINLSKKNKNVLIIFVDRAIGAYLPTIFKEHPALKTQYKGFTYYPNTLSFAGFTLLSYPAMLGGYEYTPLKLSTTDKVFEEKFKEALSVLPTIFKQNNWNSTIINPIGAEWESVLSSGVRKSDVDTLGNTELYEKAQINHYKIPKSIINHLIKDKNIEIANSAMTKRNIVYFSLLSILAPSARTYIYDQGNYHNINYDEKNKTSKYHEFFLKNYAELAYLNKITDFSENKNTFTVFNNSLPHYHAFLSYPNYDLNDNSQENYIPPVEKSGWTIPSYHVNVATIKLIGEYLDFLKKYKVYDNTRIIIVADHGFRDIDLPSPKNNNFQKENITPFNPLLLVKDFNANSEFKQSEEFMTNADVPTLATADLIENPQNPFTNKKISTTAKKEGLAILLGNRWLPALYIGRKQLFNERDQFNYVKENPTKQKNWETNLNYETIKKR